MKRYRIAKLTMLGIALLLVPLLLTGTGPSAAEEATGLRVEALPAPLSLPAAPQRLAYEAPSTDPSALTAGAWAYGPVTPFDWTRFDAVFVPGPTGEAWANKVYFPSGRTGTTPAHDNNIWSFDPSTGTYADTGHDVLVNTSNYVANLIQDDGTMRGPAVYLVGGYNADVAANHGQVQRYYPQTGDVEVLPTADDFTGNISGIPIGSMGQAVVDDIIYVFGGWESSVAPYFYAGTWAFDPAQPSGSRWTDLGVVINPARAYIQAAASGGKIYAMGGLDVWTGSELDPTDVVEVLDTADLASGWQTLTPMPVAGAEGQGFGNEAIDSNHLYVVGAADWPDGSVEAMEYNIGADSWNQAFADLNEPRRDHASAFVTLATPDPNDGLPGMWVFGGRWTGDAPPFAPTEFYAVEVAGACNVLVVDDDWDFDSLNFGGRPYYTTALDDLGTTYTVWDTVSQGDPAAADMAPYDVVVWFTGYDWQTPITPTNEIELASYLDGGGNLLLSSQEYAYAAGGVTTFMTDYLGVASVTEDVIELDPVGTAGNPVGDGLGPYAMVRPDDYDAYWPTDTYEGPYDDYVYADIGAQSPFYFSVSGEDSATNKDGGAFKTIYLGWPFEWIDTTAERAEILGAALDWMCVPSGEPEVRLLPPYQEGFANAGDIVPYDLSLTNLLGTEDTFDLTYTGNTWPSVGPSTLGPLADGVVEDFVVDVEIPPDAACLAEDIVTVTALDSTATYSDTALIRTVVGPAWQVEPSAELGAHWVASTCTDEYGAAGTCFYVGGINAAGAISSAGQMFDIDTGAWTPFAQPVPVPVFGATLGYIDGKVYLAGGYTLLTDDWGGTYALQVYDLAAGTWSAGTPIPPQGPITGAGGSNGDVLNGMLHVVGGCGANSCASNQHIAYDPVADAWTSLAPMPEGHVFFGAAAGNGRLYAGGDYFGSSSFLEYDAASDSWLSKASLPSGAGKKSPAAAVAPGAGVFWWGGDLGAWTGVQDSTWYWDPVADAWVEYTALLNTATTGAGGGMADGRLWNFAGSQGAGPILPPPHESLAFCIPPSPPAGRLEGVVYDANTNLPIEDAYVEVYREDPDYYASRHTAADGSWFIDPLVTDTYTVAVAAFNYFSSDELPVTVVADTTTTLDVYLDASMPDMSETSVSMTLLPDTTVVHNLMLDNNGTGELTFAISEVPPGTYPTRRVTAMPEGIDPALLASFAASGDGTARFVVYLADQADLTAAFAIRDWTERGQIVLDALQATADRTQAGLRAELNTAGVPFESRIIVNALVVQGDLPLAQRILARPDVAYIGANAAVEAPKPVTMSAAPDDVMAVEWNIDLVDADSVWTTFGATGAGIVVSNIDTGVLYTHPALVNQYRGNLGGSYDHNYNWWDPYGWSPTVPDDWHSHGSHTMGTMLGDDGGTNQIGMAPDAAWLACMGFDPVTGSGYTAELLECSEFILAPWDLTGANPDPARRPHIVNNSWGGGQAQWWYNQAIYAWQAAGILPVFSIGNEGPSCETAGDPGDMANILAVGATDNLDSNAPGSPADFSNRGPAAVTGLIKPDVSAPGAGIRSAYNNGAYGLMGGTSMAAPHVAGEAALIWSAQPQLLGQVELTYWLITQNTRALVVDQGYFCGTDDATTVPNNQYGWGRIDAFDAVAQAVATDWDIPWLDVDPTAGVVLPGAGAIVEMTFDSTGMVAGECVTGTLLMEFNDPYVTETTMPVELCVEEAVAVLAINKTVTLAQDPAMPGDMITYTITIENSGNADAVDVHVVDLLPAGINGTDLDTTVTVAVGTTETIEMPALIELGVGYETTIVNLATYTFGEATGQASVSFTTGPEPTGVGLSAFGGTSGQIGWLAVMVAMVSVLAGFAWRRRAA